MKQESPASVPRTAPCANRFGSKTSKPSAMKAAPVPNISWAARNTSRASNRVKKEAAMRTRKSMVLASFLNKKSLPPRNASCLKLRSCRTGN